MAELMLPPLIYSFLQLTCERIELFELILTGVQEVLCTKLALKGKTCRLTNTVSPGLSQSFLVMCDLSCFSPAGRLNRKHVLLLPASSASFSFGAAVLYSWL